MNHKRVLANAAGHSLFVLDKNCLKANTAMISSPHRAEPRRSPILRYMATPTLFPPHSSIFRERYRAARRFHYGRRELEFIKHLY
ncbi:hypothetical protein ANN_24586 [Periplaneta americana]|uniref:Uncharacterized protein n=1 Tax=Periplaneta americana TaxID=6978 RepID=A0ABQ8S3R9_PERAM|nr:hypothetical protein ANN_24586 [Periplaneta americana]